MSMIDNTRAQMMKMMLGPMLSNIGTDELQGMRDVMNGLIDDELAKREIIDADVIETDGVRSQIQR